MISDEEYDYVKGLERALELVKEYQAEAKRADLSSTAIRAASSVAAKIGMEIRSYQQ